MTLTVSQRLSVHMMKQATNYKLDTLTMASYLLHLDSMGSKTFIFDWLIFVQYWIDKLQFYQYAHTNMNNVIIFIVLRKDERRHFDLYAFAYSMRVNKLLFVECPDSRMNCLMCVQIRRFKFCDDARGGGRNLSIYLSLLVKMWRRVVLVSSLAQLFELRQIRRTVAATNTEPQERVHLPLVDRIREAPPSTAGVE